ncbi:TPA: hypothetical protein SML94_001129 [Klebsiella oxytoca]|nr:hypothetical protein [Klebsiella oxytoca]
MTSKLTRERIEWLNYAATGLAANGTEMTMSPQDMIALTESCLAALDSEPVVFTDERNLHHIAMGRETSLIWGKQNSEAGDVPLYRHAQQPLSVVPDESYQQLSDLYHAQEKRLFKIGQRIKGASFDKYSHSPSQAIDVLEAAIFGENEACRAAMLQAGYAVRDLSTPVDPQVAEYEQNVMQAGNSPVIGIDPASGSDRTVEVCYVAPPGYVMVPKEPTEAMINAWLSEVANWRGHVAGYKAMLAAAQQELK